MGLKIIPDAAALRPRAVLQRTGGLACICLFLCCLKSPAWAGNEDPLAAAFQAFPMRVSHANPDASWRATQAENEHRIDAIINSVVIIKTVTLKSEIRFWDLADKTKTASGFFVDPSGIILTNYHAVSNAGKISIFRLGWEYSAKILAIDTANDLALLKIAATDPAFLKRVASDPAFRKAAEAVTWPFLTLGDSSKVKRGDTVWALGSPLDSNSLEGTVTRGIISGLDRSIENNFSMMLQTDAAINPGNSGGPLVDRTGMVIGIVSNKRSGLNGVAFAINSNSAADFMKQFRISAADAEKH